LCRGNRNLLKNDRFDLRRVKDKLTFPISLTYLDRKLSACKASDRSLNHTAVFQPNGISKTGNRKHCNNKTRHRDAGKMPELDHKFLRGESEHIYHHAEKDIGD
jgi:hypothetical protein